MGIEDQTTQAYRTIGQPPSAPQLAPAQQTVGQLGQMGNTGQMPPEALQRYQEFLKQQQQGPMGMAGFMGGLGLSDMRARPDFNIGAPMPHQMNMPQPARPFDFGSKQQQNPYKPQFGMMAQQLGGIAEQLRRAGDNAMGNQIGKFGGGLQALGGMGDMFSKFKAAQQGPIQQQNPYQTTGPRNMFDIQEPQRVAYQKGGDVDTKETNHKHPLAYLAEELASYGRDEDTELLHVTKDELKGLLAAAKHAGGKLTINPHTGLYEAGFFSKIGRGLKKVASAVTKPVAAVAKAVKNTVGPIVTKVRDLTQTGLNAMTFGATKSLTSKKATENFNKIKDKVGPVFTKIRDAAESAAVLAGNYFVPGSSILTSRLASKGSQAQLNSGIGKVLQIASGGLGGMAGSAAGTAANAGGSGLSGLMQGIKNFGSNVVGGIGKAATGVGKFLANPITGLKSLGTNFMSSLGKLGTNIKGGISNLIKDPMGTLKNWGGKAVDFLKEKGGNVKDFLGKVLGGGGEGGEDGEGSGVNWGNLLGTAAGAYFGSQAGGGGGGGGSGTNAPAPTFYNTSFKRVLNPNYGKPGEPFYLSQEFGKGEFSTTYKEPTAQDLKVTDQGLQPNDPAAVQAPPTQAAHGGLMYADGGMLPYSGGGNIYEYSAGGKLLDGPGDGMSDSIPAEIRGKKVQKALLADGEFVIPADVVSHLGNGSTKAGSKVLYSMMDRVREARTGTTEQGKQIDANRFMPV